MSMNWFIIQRAIQNWAENRACVNAVVWQDQNAPMPPLPFIDMKIESISSSGKDFEDMPDDNGCRVLHGTREFTVAIRCFSLWSPLVYLDDLLLTLNMADVSAELNRKGIVVVKYDSPIDTTFLEDSQRIKRADASIYCRTSLNVPYGGDSLETSIIEQVTIEATYQPQNTNETLIIPREV